MLRESGKVASEGFGQPLGGLSVVGPKQRLLHGFCHTPTVEPLSSQQHARAGPLDGLHVQVLVQVTASPTTGTPAARACCVVRLPPLQTTTAERAAAASPGR